MKDSTDGGLMMSRIEMMFSWLNQRSSLISRSVRRQNTGNNGEVGADRSAGEAQGGARNALEWSNGVIFCGEGSQISPGRRRDEPGTHLDGDLGLRRGVDCRPADGPVSSEQRRARTRSSQRLTRLPRTLPRRRHRCCGHATVSESALGSLPRSLGQPGLGTQS